MSNKLFVVAVASSLLLCGAASAEDIAAAPAAPAAAPFPIRSGALLRSADGRRIGFIDAVENGKDGAPTFAQIIVDQRIVRVPASTISGIDKSHFTTSMSYKDVSHL